MGNKNSQIYNTRVKRRSPSQPWSDKDGNGDFRQNWYCQYVCNKTCEVGKNAGHAGQTDNLDEKTKQKLKKGRNRAVL